MIEDRLFLLELIFTIFNHMQLDGILDITDISLRNSIFITGPQFPTTIFSKNPSTLLVD